MVAAQFLDGYRTSIILRGHALRVILLASSMDRPESHADEGMGLGAIYRDPSIVRVVIDGGDVCLRVLSSIS